MQDDLEAPAAAANEELNEQNDDLSQAGQVWNYMQGILCHQCVFIHTAHILQRPKKSKISGRQTFTRKNFPDEARQTFPRHICQKCVIRFHDKNAKSRF